MWGELGEAEGQFLEPGGVALGPDGHVYIADRHRVQKFRKDGTFVRSWGGLGDGPGQFTQTSGIAVDQLGNVFVGNVPGFYWREYPDTDRIQKFTGDGELLTFWGETGSGTNQLREPAGLEVHTDGNVYVAEWHNMRIQVFSNEGGFIKIFHDAEFNYVPSVALDANGNVYMAIDSPWGAFQIQKFSSSGVLRAAWGAVGDGDGELLQPRGLAIDNDGNVYVSDWQNRRIQKFAPSPQSHISALQTERSTARGRRSHRPKKVADRTSITRVMR
jgi:DNA-binding beta-propeller fold protein YncE